MEDPSTPAPAAYVKDLFPTLTTFVFDVDGVLTDGTVLVTDTGNEQRTMNIRDGYALNTASEMGYRIFVITGGHNYGVAERLKRLGVRKVLMGVKRKDAAMQQLIAQEKLDVATTLYMGDDVPDVPAMRMVALPACPADACPEVYMLSKFVSAYAGGKGCVRDIIEQVLRAADKWPAL